MFLGIVSVSAVCLVLAYSGWNPQDFPTDFETKSHGECEQQEINLFTSWTDSIIVQWLQFDDRKQKALDSGGMLKMPPDKYNSNEDDETLEQYNTTFKNKDGNNPNNSIHIIPLRVKYESDREYRGRIVFPNTATMLEAWNEKYDEIDQDDSIIAYGDANLENVNKKYEIMSHDKGVILYQGIWQKTDVRGSFRKAENILTYKTENVSRDADRFSQGSSLIRNLLAFFSDCYFYFTSSRETRDIPTNGMGADKADNLSDITVTIYADKNEVEIVDNTGDDAGYIGYRTYYPDNTRYNIGGDVDYMGYRTYNPYNIRYNTTDEADYIDYRTYNPDNTLESTKDDAVYICYRTYNPDKTMNNTVDNAVYLGYRTYNPDNTMDNTGDDAVYMGYRTYNHNKTMDNTADNAVYLGYRTYNPDNTMDNTGDDAVKMDHRTYNPDNTMDNTDDDADYMDYRTYEPDNTIDNTADDAEYIDCRAYNPDNTLDNTGNAAVYMDYITYNPGHTRGNTGYYHSYATISNSDGYPFHDNDDKVDGTKDFNNVTDATDDEDDVDDNESLTLKIMIVYLAAAVFKNKIMGILREACDDCCRFYHQEYIQVKSTNNIFSVDFQLLLVMYVVDKMSIADKQNTIPE